MNLSVDQIRLLKKVIEEEVAIQYGAVSNYLPDQLSLGFIKRRLELSDYEEVLLRIIITGSEDGKLPSEQLRDKIILTNLSNQTQLDVKRNNVGSVILKLDSNPNLIVKTDVDKIKLSKLRYVYNLNFSELLNSTDSLEDLIALLRQEILDLKAKLSQSENQNENLRFAIRELETEITDLNSLIVELETRVTDLQDQVLTLTEEHQLEIQRLLEDARLQVQILQQERDALEIQKNQEINDLKSKIDNFINLENIERDRVIVQDVFRYTIDVERAEARVSKQQVTYNLSDDFQYGAYIIDSIEPTIISDLALEALREALDDSDFEAENTSKGLFVRRITQDRNLLLNPENPSAPMFASVQVYLRQGFADAGIARMTHESILMIDLVNQNALSQEQTDRLLEFSKRKAPLLR